MTKKIASIILASLLVAPSLAGAQGKINLSEYKTVAVQPILSAKPGFLESALAASAANLTFAPERAAAAQKASDRLLGSQDAGFGFAGKATAGDIDLLVLGSTLGMLPTAMKIDVNRGKEFANQLANALPKIQGKVDPDAYKALTLGVMAAQQGDLQTAAKALLVGMAISASSIKKGNERAHGYLATGLYAGIGTLWISAGTPNQQYAELAVPLITLLEEDAAMGGADHTVAAHLKTIALEVVAQAPNQNRALDAIDAMGKVQPD